MISPPDRAQLPDRAELVEAARLSIARGSKSFSLASRLFDRATRERVWLLYAWCRECDDLTDGQSLGFAAGTAPTDDAFARLAFLTTATERALAGEPTGALPFEALRRVASECAIPPVFVRAHLDGFALDAADWRPRSEADLLRYCYHVAGVVGCMMAVVMGVAPDDRDTLDRASDLGIAFQLANIARDIADDAQAGRCYLPADWLAEAGIGEGDPMAPQHREALAAIGTRLAALSAAYERSAVAGAARLPFRARWAVLAAAAIYGAIGRKVAARGPHAWDSRVIIRKRRKLASVAAAFTAAAGLTAPDPGRAGLWTRSA